MYSYSYNIPHNGKNMYRQYNNQNYINPNDQRFVGGGLVAPLLLGGVAGYALGQNNRPNYYYPQPVIQPVPVYYPVYPNNSTTYYYPTY